MLPRLMSAAPPESPASATPWSRSLRRILGFAVVATLVVSASCAKSHEVPTLPDAGGTDAGRDAGFDAGSVPTCSPPSGTMFTCGGSWSTPWFITTTNGSLNATLPLVSATGEGFDDCPRDFVVTWDAAALGRAGVTTLALHVHDSAQNRNVSPVSADGTMDSSACSLSLLGPGGSVVNSIPCRFDGCFGQDATSHAHVFSGRVRASGSGYDVDTTIAVPMCTLFWCL